MSVDATHNQSSSRAVRRLTFKAFEAAVEWLRRDGLVILLYALATILMSYPLVFKLGGDWLAMRDTDTYVKLWDNWWFSEYALRGAPLTFTDLQFHPLGLDLTYHSISWTVALFTWILTSVTDAITAYNLTILAALFTTAYAAYLLVRPYLRYRAAAWLAGVVYSFAPYHLAHSGGHPDLVHLAPIPLAVLLLITAVNQSSVLAALGSAFMVGISAFTSLYIMVLGLLTIGPIAIFLLLQNRRWSELRTWKVLFVFGAACLLFLGIRLAPVFLDTGNLSDAIEQKYTASGNQADLLSFILPSHLNPLFSSYTLGTAERIGYMTYKWPAYLGFIPLALSIIALTWKRLRHQAVVWLLIGLLFFLLSLGPVLLFNGSLYEGIPLPGQLLSSYAPIRAVGRPQLFVMGLLLPLAVLTSFGFDRLLRALEGRKFGQYTLMFALPLFLLLEYWSGEFPGVAVRVSPFYEQLADEPAADAQRGDLAIIQLPMGRQRSKRYLFLQSIHQKPIVEGLSARTSAEAYGYISSNPLLQKWSMNVPMNCVIFGDDRFIPAVDQLIDDGFGYIAVHHPGSTMPDHFAGYFPPESFYQDDDVTVYKLSEYRDSSPCGYFYEREFDLPTLDVSTSISWDGSISLLGYDQPFVDLENQTLSLGVYWQAIRSVDTSYTVYLHLIDGETGTLAAQADVIPQGWSYPTDWWTAGEVVEDNIQIELGDLPEGSYELRIGWYDPETGDRLPPVSDQFHLFPDSSALLLTIDY